MQSFSQWVIQVSHACFGFCWPFCCLDLNGMLKPEFMFEWLCVVIRHVIVKDPVHAAFICCFICKLISHPIAVYAYMRWSDIYTTGRSTCIWQTLLCIWPDVDIRSLSCLLLPCTALQLHDNSNAGWTNTPHHHQLRIKIQVWCQGFNMPRSNDMAWHDLLMQLQWIKLCGWWQIQHGNGDPCSQHLTRLAGLVRCWLTGSPMQLTRDSSAIFWYVRHHT